MSMQWIKKSKISAKKKEFCVTMKMKEFVKKTASTWDKFITPSSYHSTFSVCDIILIRPSIRLGWRYSGRMKEFFFSCHGYSSEGKSYFTGKEIFGGETVFRAKSELGVEFFRSLSVEITNHLDVFVWSDLVLYIFNTRYVFF